MYKSNKLFKLGALFLAFILVFTCVSCKAKEKTFSKLEMSIELTDEFVEKQHVGYTVYYESKDMIVVCLKEEFSLMSGSSSWSVDKYAQECVKANNLGSKTIEHRKNYVYFTFEKTLSGLSYTYVATCHKAQDGFWLIQLATFSRDFNKLEEDLFKYADSISFE